MAAMMAQKTKNNDESRFVDGIRFTTSLVWCYLQTFQDIPSAILILNGAV
jgi:hypothetical protein